MRTVPRLSTPHANPDRIAEARHAAGLTQERLARKMRCSVASVQKYEAGDRNPSERMLERLARATGKTFEFFLDDEEAVDCHGKRKAAA